MPATTNANDVKSRGPAMGLNWKQTNKVNTTPKWEGWAWYPNTTAWLLPTPLNLPEPWCGTGVYYANVRDNWCRNWRYQCKGNDPVGGEPNSHINNYQGFGFGTQTHYSAWYRYEAKQEKEKVFWGINKQKMSGRVPCQRWRGGTMINTKVAVRSHCRLSAKGVTSTRECVATPSGFNPCDKALA